MKRAPSEHFEKVLGAKLSNARYSWGARRPTDGAIFLRCWMDKPNELRWKEKRSLIWEPTLEHGKSHGIPERRKHVDLLLSGSPGFIVFVRGKEDDPDSIGDYVEDRIWPIVHVETLDDGSVWATFGAPQGV